MTLDEIRAAGYVTRVCDGAAFAYYGKADDAEHVLLMFIPGRHPSHQQQPAVKPAKFSLAELSSGRYALGLLPVPDPLVAPWKAHENLRKAMAVLLRGPDQPEE